MRKRDAAAHPVIRRVHHERSLGQLVADVVTRFAGSWWFVGLHAGWFGAWIVLRVEGYPFGLLTMAVSLEAIFLATLVMISQNRQGERDRLALEHDVQMADLGDKQNREILASLGRIERRLDLLAPRGRRTRPADALSPSSPAPTELTLRGGPPRVVR